MIKEALLSISLIFTPAIDAGLVPQYKDPESVTLSILNPIAPFKVQSNAGYHMEKIADEYHVYLEPQILDEDYYDDLNHGLRLLTEKDTVVIHVNNYGGSVHSGMEIMAAMEDSKAHIIARVESPSYSMASLIACQADELYIHDTAYLMFHTYSGGFQGKSSDSRSLIEALDTLMVRVLTTRCHNILTPEQVSDLMKGIDVYVHPK